MPSGIDKEYLELEDFLLRTGVINENTKASILERRSKHPEKAKKNEELNFNTSPALKTHPVESNLSKEERPEKPSHNQAKIENIIEVTISPDLMQAHISLNPHHGLILNHEIFYRILRRKNIKHGILKEKIAEILQKYEQGIPVQNELIAQGKMPVHGHHAVIYYLFRLESFYTPKVEQSETIAEKFEYRNVQNITMVQAGELLAYKTPLTIAENGWNVCGEVLFAKTAKDMELNAGKHTKLDENNRLWALRDGIPILEQNDCISVNPLYQVPGNIDLSVGNIDFNGTVEVKGSILSGFSVQSEHLIVHESVEAAVLNIDEDVEIFGCYSGGDKGYIKTGGNCFISHCNRGRLEIKGNLLVGRELVSMQAFVSGNLSFKHKRGTIIGGNLFVAGNLSCGNIGSSLGVTTCIYMGLHPIIKQKIASCVEKIDKFEQKIKIMKSSLRSIHSNDQEMSVEDKLLLISKIKDTISNLERQKEEIETNKKTLEADLYRYSPHFVRVEGHVYPGVRIQIGEAILKNDTLLSRVEIYEDPSTRKIKWRTLS